MRITGIIAIILALLISNIFIDGSVSAAALQVTSPEYIAEGKISPDVSSTMTTLAPGEQMTVIVTMTDQANLGLIQAASRAARQQGVVRALQAQAAASQKRILAFLKARSAQGEVSQVAPFWVFNGLAVTATQDVIQDLATRVDVAKITPDEIQIVPAAGQALNPPEPNLTTIQAPELWDLGWYGQGIVVASMDTGVDASHPDLAPRWRGGTNSWYDPYGQHATPTDLIGHGTWTMGVMVGGDAGGTTIGVAPQAQWISVKIFNDSGSATATAIHQGYQWLLDPDGDPSTPDAPHVVNNSWGFGSPGCNLEFQLDIQSLRAIGILPVFSAGNYGPGLNTSVSPANYPGSFAVGAVDSSDQLYALSSRGPSACDLTTFPEIVAPGVGIHTSNLYSSYSYESGTSLAAPHASGGLALLLSSDLSLNPEEQYDALIYGATDLNPAGPDNSSGYGRMDLLAAYQWLSGPIIEPPATNPGDLDTTFGPNGVTYTDIGTASGDKAFAVLVQPDQKIVLAGSSSNGSDDDFAVARYSSLGILDPNFSDDGKQTTAIGSGDDVAYDVGIQSDGKIVVAGSAFDGTDNDFALARYTITGTLDTTFGVNGVVTITISAGDDVARALAIQPDDKIVVVGSADGDFAVARYSSEGGLDTATFGGGDGIVITDLFGATDVANAIAIQLDDGKLVVAGFSDIGASDEFAVARYLVDGSLDTTFAGTGWVTTDFSGNSVDQAYSVDIQTDGKIVLAGFINSGATDDFALARYNSTGSLDTTFGTDGKVVTPVGSNDDQAYSVAIQPTGRIVVAGFSDNAVPTHQDFSLARYTITGTLDTTLGATGVISTDLGTINTVNNSVDQAYAVDIQADNKIIVAGFTDHPAGNDNFAVVRYESPNTPPTLAKVYKTDLEDSEIPFTAADFTSGFSDVDGDILRVIKITSLPDFGTLNLSGTAVIQNQEILSTEIVSLTFSSDGDFYGNSSFRWNGSDGLDYASVHDWVEFSVIPVNDAPSYTKGADQVVLEDAGPQFITHWAADISPGGLFENNQALAFTLTSSNDALFAVLPQVDAATGNLTYTPAADVNGSATITLTLADNGGTLYGGVDTSTPQVFSITILPVNDPPTISDIVDQFISADSATEPIIFLIGDIDNAVGELVVSGSSSDQTLVPDEAFTFSGQGAERMLVITPALNQKGTATITINVSDGLTLSSDTFILMVGEVHLYMPMVMRAKP